MNEGAQVNIQNELDGDTALMEASFWGHADVLPLLLNAGKLTNETKHTFTVSEYDVRQFLLSFMYLPVEFFVCGGKEYELLNFVVGFALTLFLFPSCNFSKVLS